MVKCLNKKQRQEIRHEQFDFLCFTVYLRKSKKNKQYEMLKSIVEEVKQS